MILFFFILKKGNPNLERKPRKRGGKAKKRWGAMGKSVLLLGLIVTVIAYLK